MGLGFGAHGWVTFNFTSELYTSLSTRVSVVHRRDPPARRGRDPVVCELSQLSSPLESRDPLVECTLAQNQKTGTLPNSARPRPTTHQFEREPTATRTVLYDTRTSQKRYAPACCFTGCLYPTTLTPSPPWRSGSTTLLNPGVVVARLASRQAHGAGARGAPRLVSSK